jgi:hypothetical protein
MSLRERFGIVGEVLFWCLIALVVTALITFGTMAIQGKTLPWWLSIQRQAVEQSKSFTDANNNMLSTYSMEYQALDTKIAEAKGDQELISVYKAQQKAILRKMCQEVSTMSPGTVNPQTLQWMNSEGGCY